MDSSERGVILSLGSGPKTLWWLTAISWGHKRWIETALKLAIDHGFVEERGVEYLYPQTDRRDGSRSKRGKRLKSWTEKRTYYALTDVGRVLLPLDSRRLGEVC